MSKSREGIWSDVNEEMKCQKPNENHLHIIVHFSVVSPESTARREKKSS